MCSWKSVKDWSETRLEPDFELVRTPPTTFHWFSPVACHPFRSLPLNRTMGSPQTGSPVLFREGARTAVQLYFLPSVKIIVPVKPFSVTDPSNSRSLVSASHCGGMVKLNFSPLKLTLAIGRALPLA